MSKSKKHLDLNIDEIAERYQAGESLTAIAQSYGCAITTIQSRLIDAGVPRRPVGREPVIQADISELVRRYEAGESTRTLADAVGAGPTWVSEKLKGAGVKLRSAGRRQSPIDRKKVVALYASGDSCEKIGKKMGYSKIAIYYYLKKWGVEMRQRDVPESSVREICRLYREGATIQEIRERTGYNPRTIYRKLRDNGVELRQVKTNYVNCDGTRRRVFSLHDKGYSNRQIAKSLGTSPTTIGHIVNSAATVKRKGGLADVTVSKSASVLEMRRDSNLTIDEIADITGKDTVSIYRELMQANAI